MFLDIAKYVLTIVVIGGLVSERIDTGAIILGLILATCSGVIGYFSIPEEDTR